MNGDSTVNMDGYRTNGITSGNSAAINSDNSMKCPACNKGEILFNIYELLAGASFSCVSPECDAAISMVDNDSKAILQDTMDAANQLIK